MKERFLSTRFCHTYSRGHRLLPTLRILKVLRALYVLLTLRKIDNSIKIYWARTMNLPTIDLLLSAVQILMI
jgi:hypothetical protein